MSQADIFKLTVKWTLHTGREQAQQEVRTTTKGAKKGEAPQSDV
jgi:hypothetical protein